MKPSLLSPFLMTIVASNAAIVTPTLNWDAALDSTANNLWESSVNSADNTSFTFPGGAQSPTDVSGSSNLPGVSLAYSMPASIGDMTSFDAITIPGGGNASSMDASFELIIRPTDFDNNYFLFETGGNGAGLGIFTVGSELVFRAQQAANDAQDAEVRQLLPLGALDLFHQVVGTINLDPVAGNNSLSLYLNGSLIGSDSASGILNDFAGGDLSGIGNLGGGSLTGTDNSVVSSTFTNFNGDIAALRYYDRELTAAEVQQNFDAISVPEPSGTLLTLAASLFFIGRRKR